MMNQNLGSVRTERHGGGWREGPIYLADPKYTLRPILHVASKLCRYAHRRSMQNAGGLARVCTKPITCMQG